MKLSLGRFFGRGATIPTVAVPKAVFDLSPKTEVCRFVLDHGNLCAATVFCRAMLSSIVSGMSAPRFGFVSKLR
jgi:hypothetical protein